MNNVLVNLFDKHNQGSLLAIDKIKPSKVIYIIDNEMQDLFKQIKSYEENLYPEIKFENHIIDINNIFDIKSILEKLCVNETTVNVTGGERIYSLVLLNESLNLGFRTIYVDVLNKFVYEFGTKIDKKTFEFKDLSLINMLKLTGTNLITDSTIISEKEDILAITKKIYDNLSLWYKNKRKLYDNSIFIHDCYKPNLVSIKINNLDFEDRKVLNSCLLFLKQQGGIEYNRICDEIEVEFLNDYLKGFIFKSGTWLEVLTNTIVKEITEVDEVKSGVIFLWKECNRSVKNELDVVAVKDSIFTCISCKDSEKYDEDALNELEVYSKRLGGNTVKKILVATKVPSKQCVIERAKAMNINLIILDEDIDKFRRAIREVILDI